MSQVTGPMRAQRAAKCKALLRFFRIGVSYTLELPLNRVSQVTVIPGLGGIRYSGFGHGIQVRERQMHAPVVATLIGSPGLGPGLCHDRGLFSLTITTSDSRSEHTVACQYY